MPDAGIAILAKAPLPGFAKTRLIPLLGPEGAAALQARLIVHTVEIVAQSGLVPATLWGAPASDHPLFQEQAAAHGLSLRDQPHGDLGARILAAFDAAAGPLLVIGTDAPALTTAYLRMASAALEGGSHVVLIPAGDGGYVLIGAARAYPFLFDAMPWSTDRVAAMTRDRAAERGLSVTVAQSLWDVDTEADYHRLLASGLMPLS